MAAWDLILRFPVTAMPSPFMRHSSLRHWLAAAFVALAVICVFGRTIGHDFINYDDPAYVTNNPIVKDGVSVQNVRLAMSATGETNLWHPLTWVSHQLDCSVFGIHRPGAHHAVNVLLHAATAVMLGMLTFRITGWRTACWLLALAWALHPQRVQSVAWISQRKDLLSGFFIFFSMYAWLGWRIGGHKKMYAAALLGMLCALASKPVAVALPAAFLLLDVWHAKRIPTFRQLIPQAPAWLMAIAAAAVAIHFQSQGGLGDFSAGRGLASRLVDVPLTLAFQFHSWIWPAPFRLWIYPPEGGLTSHMRVFASTALLVFIAIGALRIGKREPLVLLGLGLLVVFWLPVSGIVPVSFYAVADRYTYLPQAGLWLAAAACLHSLVVRWPARARAASAAAAVLAIVPSACVTWVHAGRWRDSETLFTYEMSVNPRSLLAPIHLGAVFMEQQRTEEALALFDAAAALDPHASLAQINRGNALLRLQRKIEAEAAYRTTLSLKPFMPDAAIQLAVLLRDDAQADAAAAMLEKTIRAHPGHPSLHMAYGSLLGATLGRHAEAATQFRHATRLSPHSAEAWLGLAAAAIQCGQAQDARAAVISLRRIAPGQTTLLQTLEEQIRRIE